MNKEPAKVSSTTVENGLDEKCLYYLPNLTAQQATHLLKECNQVICFKKFKLIFYNIA